MFPSKGFAAYISVMCAAALALVVGAASAISTSGSDALVWAGFLLLFVLAEYAMLFFHRTDGRVGLSLSEAVMLTMLTGLTWGEVVLTVAIGSVAIAVAHRRLGTVKSLFNVSSFTVAAAIAAWIPMQIGDVADVLVAQLGAAALGTVAYSLLTHINVASAISLAEREPFVPLVLDFPRASVLNVGAGVLLGLHLAAAYSATHWALLLFPFALVAISLGYRAVVQQDQERLRVQSLHDASRALAATPDLDNALTGFLESAARATSSLGASVALNLEDDVTRSSVYAGEVTANREAVRDPGALDLLAFMQRDRRPLMDSSEIPADLRRFRSGLGARSFLAVPLVERDEVVGTITVVDRVEATDFGEDDARLLEALANDLSLTLGSRRLFNEIVQERERFQLLVEGVTDYAIYMLDPQGLVVSWNAGAQRILGYRSEEIVGTHFSRFFPAKEDVAWMNQLSGAVTQGRYEVEGRRVRADGSTFLAEVVTSPLRDASGELRGFAMVTRDVTERATAQRERESLEAQLHQSQRLESVGQLAGGIAHDFNNILSVITNCSAFILDELTTWDLNQEQSLVIEDVNEIKGAAERAAALTRQLLVFSRRDVIEPQILHLNDLIQNLHKLMSRAIGDSVAIETSLSGDLRTVQADPGQVEQVLLNLALNARDAMDGSGKMVIGTRNVDLDAASSNLLMDLHPGPHIELSIKDSGCGMEKDVVARAFDPFFTTKAKGHGTGLGLATVYAIVKRSNGHIAIDSQPNEGTTFTIYLPVVEDESTGSPAPVPEESLPEALGETILLVEDEDSVRAVARRILDAAGYKVLEASNGKDALEMVQSWDIPIHLLLTDVIMPGMSGIELVEKAGALRPEMKKVFMSAYSEAMSSGPVTPDVGMIQKPFDRQQILERVRGLLDG